MGIATATIEMQTPEEYRERLHDLVKATRTVMVLWGRDDRGARIAGRPMALLGAADDTTMYVGTPLDPRLVADLMRDPRVMVAVQGAGCALFDAEAVISRDRALIDELAGAWRASCWSGAPGSPGSSESLSVLVVSPIAGTYWDGPRPHAYQYRLAPLPVQRELSDGVPMEI